MEELVKMRESPTIDVDKARAWAESLVPVFRKFVEQVSKVANGLIKLWQEFTRSRMDRAVLELAYTKRLVNGRVYYLAHHSKPRTRKKQYGRARRTFYRSKRKTGP